MEAITIRRHLLSRVNAAWVARGARAVVQAFLVFLLAQHAAMWPLALALVVAAEVLPLKLDKSDSGKGWGAAVIGCVPAMLVGASAALIIATVPRLVTQLAVTIAYACWRVWWSGAQPSLRAGLLNLLVVQAAWFEGVFLMAAVWRISNWLVLGLVWVGSYTSVFAVLSRRGERAAGVMAATWALVSAEVSWILSLWLFTYTMTGGYLMVPQPALVLAGLGYCFGSIYISQREGSLSRGRLTEYLLIGLILIAIVVTGTPWRGAI